MEKLWDPPFIVFKIYGIVSLCIMFLNLHVRLE